MIIPPLQVKLVIERTAQSVSRKPELEVLIKERCATDPKFSFLFDNDPYVYHSSIHRQRTDAYLFFQTNRYHIYYKHQLDGQSTTTTKQPTTKSQPQPPPRPALVDEAVTTTAAPAVSKLRLLRAKKETAREPPKEPPSEDVYSVPLPQPPPGPLELDVMKLAAQHVAQNGESFQTALARNEARNSLFDFLKPLHHHFPIFQRLVEAYSAILRPDGGRDGIVERMRAMSVGTVLDRAWHIRDWERLAAQREAQRADAVVSAGIDWHDFTPVATIDINSDDEALPAAIADAKQLPRVLAAEERRRRESAANRQSVDMDVDDEPTPNSGNVHVADVHADVPAARVRPNNSAPPAAATTVPRRETGVQLPSGQIVPASEAEGAVRVELHDTSYKEERARAAEKNKQKNLASDAEMVRSLARMNAHRAAGEVYNRADLQKRLAARTAPPPASDAPMPPPEKRARIEAARAALNTRANEPVDAEDELPPVPESEKVATPAGLIDADEWVRRVGEAVQISVLVAKHSNKSWNANGQTIELKAPLANTVLQLKKCLVGQVKVPANKQKLASGTAGFMKDKMTLAFYNVGHNEVLKMEIKERGKKKKG